MFGSLRQQLSFLITLLIWVSAIGIARAQQAVPPLSGRVNDRAGVLSSQAVAAVGEMLRAHEEKTGNQIAVLIVPSTQPEAIEAYSLRVVENWKLGRKGHDDGALFLVAINDRKMRIEVGYGLEGVLPDVICKRIIAEIVAPRLKAKDYAGGITDGVTAIISNINKSGEFLLPPKPANQTDSSLVVFFLFFIFIALSFLTNIIASLTGRRRIVASSGGLFPGNLSTLGTGYHPRSSGRSWGGGGFGGGGGSFGGGGASGSW